MILPSARSKPGACSICPGTHIQFTMIEFRLSRTAFRVDFSFVAVLALFFWLDTDGFGLTALAVCAAHEAAHLAVMLACGITPECVTFYGAGIRITAPETELRSTGVQAAVYSAGCMMNFLLAIALHFAGLPGAAAVSCFTGCFNLLPVGEFDGRRLLRLFVVAHARAENVDAVMFWGGVLSAVIFGAAAAVLGRGVSPTLLITAAYIVVMALRRV